MLLERELCFVIQIGCAVGAASGPKRDGRKAEWAFFGCSLGISSGLSHIVVCSEDQEQRESHYQEVDDSVDECAVLDYAAADVDGEVAEIGLAEEGSDDLHEDIIGE